MNKIKKFFHNLLGWGYPLAVLERDSFQPSYACRFCDGKLAQDSNGDYFHLTIL
jgi:hypothetical protein